MSKNIDEVKRKCELIISYLKSNGGGDTMNEFTAVLEKTYLQKDSKGLQTILNDLSEWAMSLQPIHANKDVDEILHDFTRVRRETALKIIDSGKISSDSEYELVYYFVNTNFMNKSEGDFINAANELLSRYSVGS